MSVSDGTPLCFSTVTPASCNAAALSGGTGARWAGSGATVRPTIAALTFADGQVAHLGIGVDLEAETFGGLVDLGPQAPPRDAQALGRESQRDVLEDRERGHEPQVLEHHADARGASRGRRARGEEL